jgi:branched-subunit amino acid transport protein
MSPAVILLLAAAATWALRVAFIAVIPAELLPARIRRGLDDVAPAVAAAIIATHLADGVGLRALPSLDLVAAGVAGAVAWRTRNLGATVVVGVAAVALLHLI